MSTLSNVYFTNLRSHAEESRLTKLKKVIMAAGIGKLDVDGKFVAIKMHFGEPGNLTFLRPNYAKVVADVIKEHGGKPFLTDCNTLYVGGRKNALEHMDSANLNGFNPQTTGCQIIIADGLKGSDEASIPVEGGVYVKEAKIGRALADADVIISLAHFKGHEATGFGGTLKNLGMGGGSRAGKMEQHCDGKPDVDQALCIGCGACRRICANDAPQIVNHKCHIDHDKCVGCGRCIAVCPKDAIANHDSSSNDKLNCKISEYAKAVIDGKPAFFINLVIDVSPNCDCHSENDTAIVPDIGFFASYDPVALDRACCDAVNKATPMPNSTLSDQKPMDDNLDTNHPDTNWRVGLEHAEHIGLGTQAYHLVDIS
ncbi:MAG: DUF362 domain-containing protein [Sphaerochaeta sp.]|jgi:uncharacterized Fe-S center protein|nr:DUF362 domain-containing protein [Sphaerochaeta sp.]MCH3919980.1 DUF362 domain-containing protein [Sphaerochaeta sp.]MCI2076708.1 DUF362 domain-containing protein [Sphaerochaeta sp.]MCI2097779.1 DUF362 domain-containing protein [Sphaerochaeta sp.]MCI2105062.1 DUF362 domain-containing protein [Sphaerochaeta sp.]